MTKNLGLPYRLFRYLIGIALIAWAIGGGPIWTYGGFYFLLTASFGFCPILRLVGTATHERHL